MEITGKIIVALPEVTGRSARGNDWKKREYVLETLETYPKKIFFDFFGDRADQFPLSVGQTIRLSFDIESREYNGRWYTSIRGWKSEPADQAQPAAAAAAPAPGQAYPNPQGYAAPASRPAAAPAPATPAAPAYTAAPAAPADDLPF